MEDFMRKLLFCLLFMFLLFSQIYAQISIISNKDVTYKISNIQQVIDIYILETKTDGKKNFVVFDLMNGEVKGKFLSAIDKTSTDLKKVWMKAQLSGEGKAPEALSSESDVIKKVSSTAGGIGYVSSSNVTPDVNVLFTVK
jgi:hypothetical protein